MPDSAQDNFKKNFNKLENSTYPIHNISGLPSFTHKWDIIHTDALLALIKYFKKKYNITGKRERMEKMVSQIGSEKSVRASAVYSPFKILRKNVLYSKFKNPEKARIFQYKNKFFPLSEEDLHILAVDLVGQSKLLGPCQIVNLTGATQLDMGNILGDQKRTDRVFRFLEVPEGENPNKEHEKTVDASGKKLTKHQLDMFNTDPNEKSLDIGFENPEAAEASIEDIGRLKDRAHKVRATLLMIRRAKASLQRVKDPEKRKNLKASLKKYIAFKKKIVDK